MGSRVKPNHGGSGLADSRKSRKNPVSRRHIEYGPIRTESELESYLSGNTIACLLCGGEYKSLGQHLYYSHAMSSRDYKEKFNIPVTRSLSGVGLREKKRQITKDIWINSDKMKAQRPRLQKNVRNLRGSEHKTKSTIPKAVNKIRMAKVKQNQDELARVKYRAIYIDYIKEAIAKDVTLYTIFKATAQIYAFAKRHSDDEEFKSLLALVKKPTLVEAGDGKVESTCENCGTIFLKRHDRPTKACSRKCSSMLRSNKVEVPCAVCSKPMLLTPSELKKIKTCSPACKGKRVRARRINESLLAA